MRACWCTTRMRRSRRTRSRCRRMTQQSIGATPMGVFRAVERPVYDELMAEQIEVAKAKGEGELAALLGSGDTWSIE